MKEIKEVNNEGLHLELDETPEGEKGKWFKVPGFQDTYLRLTQMLRHEHRKIVQKASFKKVDHKTRQMVDDINVEIVDKEYDRSYVSHIHEWKGVYAKRKNEKGESYRVPLEFSTENVEKIINVWASKKIGTDDNGDDLTFINWLKNTLSDPESFVTDDTENLPIT